MRNLLAFLAAVTLTVVAVGWYLDWYKVRRSPSPSGDPSVTVDFDTKKIGDDLGKAQKAIQKKLSEKAEKPASIPAPEPKPDEEAPMFEVEATEDR
jgi:hypothetical protein